MSRPGVTATSPWVPRRRRAEVLRDRYPFAAEVLTLYLALLDVWEEAWGTAREEPPEVGALAGWAAARVLPRIVEATARAGPEPLAAASRTLLEERTASEPLAAWLAGEELSPVQCYLARASLRAPIEALPALRGTAAAQLPRPLRRRAGDRAPAPRLRALLGELELRRQRLRVVRGNRGRAAHRLRRAARAAGGGSWRRQRLRADLPAPPHRRLRELQAISDRRRPRS